MNASSPEPHDHQHGMPHASPLSAGGHEHHEALAPATTVTQAHTTGMKGTAWPCSGIGSGSPLPLSLPTLVWCGMVLLHRRFAAVLMSASTVIVAINAQLLRRVKV